MSTRLAIAFIPDRLDWFAVRLVVGISLVLPYSFAPAGEQPGPAAVETFEPEFDVAYAYEPRAGQFGITELMIAALHADESTVNALVDAGADVNERDQSQSTALMWAVHSGDASVVDLMLEHGADVNAVAYQGATALTLAISGSNEDIAIALVNAGARLEHAGTHYLTYLERAAESGQAELIDALIANGVDVPQSGTSALIRATKGRHHAIVVSLLGAGVDINAAGTHSQDVAILVAARSGDVAMVELLLSHGASAVQAARNVWPLWAAVTYGHAEVTELLLSNGASAAPELLFLAVRNQKINTAWVLLDWLDINSLSQYEIDRLLIAADNLGEEEFVQMLLGAAAAPSLNDQSVRLLFARNGDENCNLKIWDPRLRRESAVYSADGECNDNLFVAHGNSTLFVSGDDDIRVISLNNAFADQQVALPAVEIASQMEALAVRINTSYAGRVNHSPTARIATIGYLESGELAFATHTWGPADETYALLFGRYSSRWILVAEQTCDRFDGHCRFQQMNGRRITDWGTRRTAWHPSIRMNRYFVSKTAGPNRGAEYGGEIGNIRFEIDGAVSNIRFTTGEGGHCSEECTYTTRIELQLAAGAPPIVFTDTSGNNSFAGHYVLVHRKSRGATELFDIRTGKSVLGPLGMATWVE